MYNLQTGLLQFVQMITLLTVDYLRWSRMYNLQTGLLQFVQMVTLLTVQIKQTFFPKRADHYSAF